MASGRRRALERHENHETSLYENDNEQNVMGLVPILGRYFDIGVWFRHRRRSCLDFGGMILDR